MCTPSLSCESCVCNVHCVQFALYAVDPNSAFLTGCSPIPLTPFQLFSGQSSLFTSPAAIGVFVERLTSAQNHITLSCTKQYLCLVLTCLQSLRRDSNTFHNQLYCQKHIKQNNGQRKYPDSQRGITISSTTDLRLPEPWIGNPVEVAERQHCLFGGKSSPVQDLLHLGSLVN